MGSMRETRKRMNIEVLPEDEPILRRARGYAGEHGTSLRALVFTALQEKLTREGALPSADTRKKK